MSYYSQQQPPPGVPPSQGCPTHGEGKDGYPPPGYSSQGYPPQGYPPPQHYAQPPPVQQTGDSASLAASKGCLEGCLAALCCCCLLDACF
ncbi:protein CYSTEINE-RICH TRANSMEMBRANE MODULE 13-like [Actinidia eriantha]|uniref:protein CYSTEINE-RICH TRANSMEMBRANE MODULE 13-like n=1 Tax=Actinidia eriantha TaxID=165200 RepID=UPI002585E551|nr:protein CYSTEINE-RICH TRANSMEMBRANE MODULE 13-like [Actinidia eriantha]